MSVERKAYENHYVTEASGYADDRFRCTNVGGEVGGWVTTDWLVFSYCPLCGQELEDRLFDPEHEIPPEGI